MRLQKVHVVSRIYSESQIQTNLTKKKILLSKKRFLSGCLRSPHTVHKSPGELPEMFFGKLPTTEGSIQVLLTSGAVGANHETNSHVAWDGIKSCGYPFRTVIWSSRAGRAVVSDAASLLLNCLTGSRVSVMTTRNFCSANRTLDVC